MKIIILICFFLSTFTSFSQETIAYKTLSTDTVIIDSVLIVNKTLEKKIKKYIKKTISNDTQFVFIVGCHYENIKTDTVDFEFYLEKDFSYIFNTHSEIVYTKINNILVLIHCGAHDTVFFKRSYKNRLFYYDKRFYFIMPTDGEKCFSIYFFYYNKRGKYKCKNGKNLYPLVYRKYSWFRSNILYRKKAKKYGLIKRLNFRTPARK